ncbi:complement C1q 2 [Labeo rohita]|uniref:Complement C1q 2 n=1 Tax=Labeo rohita TaxID=84645 RepID=A0A498NMU2_LABRO|nr:complement C1q 2 [Labeo rohita]
MAHLVLQCEELKRDSSEEPFTLIKAQDHFCLSTECSQHDTGEQTQNKHGVKLLSCYRAEQKVDGGLDNNEISQQLSSGDRRDTLRDEASTDSQQYCHLSFSDIHAALRELTATVTEQKANIRALETQLREQQTFFLEELNKKSDEISNLTLSQVEELRKENRDREIVFSAALMQSNSGYFGPFTTEITLTYRNVFTNIGNAYNPITGVFTAPLRGAYRFTVSSFGHDNPSNAAYVSIMKNEGKVVMAYARQGQGSVNTSNGVVLILEVGDVVYVRLWPGSRIFDNDNNHNTFSGNLLFPLREQELCRMCFQEI